MPLLETMAKKERDYKKMAAELKELNKVLESGDDSNGCKLKKTDDAIAVSHNASPPTGSRAVPLLIAKGGANWRAWTERVRPAMPGEAR